MIEFVVMHKTERINKADIEYQLATRRGNDLDPLHNITVKSEQDFNVGDVFELVKKNES